jgi:hypothetical protein
MDTIVYKVGPYRIKRLVCEHNNFNAYTVEKKIPFLPIYKKLKYLYKSEFEDFPPLENVYFSTLEDAKAAIEKDIMVQLQSTSQMY